MTVHLLEVVPQTVGQRVQTAFVAVGFCLPHQWFDCFVALPPGRVGYRQRVAAGTGAASPVLVECGCLFWRYMRGRQSRCWLRRLPWLDLRGPARERGPPCV